jgi:hypothetical protein
LIHYPKYLDTKFKKAFEFYFEKKILGKNYQIEHPIIFYARTIAAFITHIFEGKKNPFSKVIVDAKTVPVSALRSIYKYKFDVVLRYVNSIDGFKFNKFYNAKETFADTKATVTNFVSTGSVCIWTRASYLR